MVGKSTLDVVAAIGGQGADQVLADRGVVRERCAHPRDGILGKLRVHLCGQIGAGRQLDAHQSRRMADEAHNGVDRGSRVPKRHLLNLLRSRLMGAIAGSARRQ
ncbi:hypothetical protein [Nonomuraea sp. NPDC049607]|uniref:hypothetical protein n=1 Tax=Nonomuraea sp. NPDC049607 TaxID=3154732 RepID=UPI003414FB0D